MGERETESETGTETEMEMEMEMGRGRGRGRVGEWPPNTQPAGPWYPAVGSGRVCWGGGPRALGQRHKSLDRGMTFNRSQRGSCSATYDTLTQNQVVCK